MLRVAFGPVCEAVSGWMDMCDCVKPCVVGYGLWVMGHGIQVLCRIPVMEPERRNSGSSW